MAWFIEGGLGNYLVLGSAVVVGLGCGIAFLFAVVGWFFRPLRVVARIVGALAIFACVLPMIFGVGASFYARSQLAGIVEGVEPEQRQAIIAHGQRLASIPTTFGGALTCLLLMPAGFSALIALTIPAPPSDDDDDDY